VLERTNHCQVRCFGNNSYECTRVYIKPTRTKYTYVPCQNEAYIVKNYVIPRSRKKWPNHDITAKMKSARNEVYINSRRGTHFIRKVCMSIDKVQ